jgi:2-dehydropantoate 2-reductase
VNAIVLGAGLQGTVLGVRLARACHDVTLVARGVRAAELRERGAAIECVLTGRVDALKLPVIDQLQPNSSADLCFVTVRREQLEEVLPDCAAALGVARFVIMVNHANGSDRLFGALGRERVVLGFPGAAGGIENGVARFVDIPEQATVIEATSPDVAAFLKGAGFRVSLVHDMDSWLQRHAVFVTAICGALYATGVDARRLAAERGLVRELVLAVRDGWAALDSLGIAPAPPALRAIFCWLPTPFGVTYWQRLLRSPRGEQYFAIHARHAAREMARLADDVRALFPFTARSRLRSLYAAIDQAAGRAPAAT